MRAGGGKEADAEVQVLPDAQATLAEGDHSTAHVTRDLLPGCPVGAQQGVGLAVARRLQLDRAVIDHRVPLALAVDAEADARRAAGHVDHVGVEALDQGGEPGGRTALWCRPLFGVDNCHAQSMELLYEKPSSRSVGSC